MADPKIKYDIEAAVKGADDASKLASVVTELGDVLEGDLQKGARDAAAALESLASKQRALDAFGKLKLDVQGLSTSLNSQVGTVERLAVEMGEAAGRVKAMSAAERESREAVEHSRAELQSKRDALKSLREETTGAARREEYYRQAVTGLKESIAQSRAELKTYEAALRTASQATMGAVNAETALDAQYKLAVGSAAKLSGELRTQNTALVQAREVLGAAGISTANLAAHQKQLQTAVAQVRQEVLAMAPVYRQAAAASTQSTQVQAQNQRTLREGMTSISTQLSRIQQIASVALGGSYAMGLAKSVAETADGVKNLGARVQLVTGEGENFQKSWQGVTKIALDTNSALDETGTLFARLAKASEEGGMAAVAAQQRALGLTTTINQAMQLSGGSAESAKAALTQLIQGLQSGVLRGEEFNSVMEQAPRLAQALANGLGVTTGELRKLAEQGALTSQTVMKALEGQAGKVASEFEKLPPTVGRALQNLSTQWSLYVGEADKGMLSSANAAKVIDALAKNLDTVVTTLTTAGKLWAAMQIAKLAGDFANWATSTLTATKAIEANTVATTANTTAQRTNTVAQAASLAAQNASTAATTANTAAKAANAKEWASFAAFSRAAMVAESAASAAIASGTTAVVAKTSALGMLGKGVGGVTRLLGGPVGLIVTVAMFNSEIGKGIAAVRDWAFSFTEAGAQLKAAEKSIRESEESLKRQQQAAKDAAEAQRLLALQQEEARNRAADLSKEAAGLIANFDKMRKDGDSAAEAIGKIGKDFDLSTIPGIRNATAVLDKLVADAKITASEFNAAWAQALDGKDLAKFEVMARSAFKQAGIEADKLREKISDAVAKGASKEAIKALEDQLKGVMSVAAREAERAATMMEQVLRAAVARTGLEFDQLQGKIGAASRTAINDLDAIVDGLDRLKAEGVDTGRVLNASISKAIDTADSQRAIDEVRARIEQLRKVLGDKVADGLLDQAAEKSKLLQKNLEDAIGGIQSVAEAMRRLGVTTDESLKTAAKGSKEAFDYMAESGKASARELSDAFKKAAEDAIAANKGVAPEWVKAQAAARGYVVTVDDAGKSTLKLKDATDKSTDSFNKNAGAINDTRTALEKLNDEREREIAAQEKSNQLAEREQELYRKKWNIDKDGFTVGSGGGRIQAQAKTEGYVLEVAQAQNLTDKQTTELLNKYFQNGQATGWVDDGSLNRFSTTWFSQVVDAAVKMRVDAIKAAGSAPLAPVNPSPSPGTGGGGSTVIGQTIDRVVNVYVNSKTGDSVPTNGLGEAAIKRVAQRVLDLLEADRRAAGL